MRKIKIVFGGQTGVDRAALDVALEFGIDCGGCCPQGRLAEDGVIPARYPLIELNGAGYRERTRQNVIDSDGTVIIYFDTISGGTEQTLHFCLQLKKPYLLLDATELSAARCAERIRQFVNVHALTIVNFAGPRASSEASAYLFTHDTLMCFSDDKNS